MSKVLWHTMTIKVPSEMVEITKTGKVSIKKTLTKMNNISKSQGYPSIKLVSSSDNKPHIITDGKEWNINQLKTNLKKANELATKNKGKVLKQPVSEQKLKKKILNASYDIMDAGLGKVGYVPNIAFLKTLKLDGKPFWSKQINDEYNGLKTLSDKNAFLRRKLLDYGELQYDNKYWTYI